MFQQTLKTLALTACMSVAWSASALADITVRIMTPDSIVFDGTVEEATVPTASEVVGLLAGSSPTLIKVDTGVMRIRDGQTWRSIMLMEGFAEFETDELTVVVDSAELGSSINIDQARQEFNEAEQRLTRAESGDNQQEKIEAAQAFKTARARFQAAGGQI